MKTPPEKTLQKRQVVVARGRIVYDNPWRKLLQNRMAITGNYGAYVNAVAKELNINMDDLAMSKPEVEVAQGALIRNDEELQAGCPSGPQGEPGEPGIE